MLFSNIEPASLHLIPCVSLAKCVNFQDIIPNTEITYTGDTAMTIKCSDKGEEYIL